MPGYMLSAECPCGFSGGANVGVTGFGVGKSKLLVAAYDPEKEALVSIDAEKAEERNLTTYDDPYAYDPIKLVVEGDMSAAPKGDAARYLCPLCGKETLRFYKCGFWD